MSRVPGWLGQARCRAHRAEQAARRAVLASVLCGLPVRRCPDTVSRSGVTFGSAPGSGWLCSRAAPSTSTLGSTRSSRRGSHQAARPARCMPVDDEQRVVDAEGHCLGAGRGTRARIGLAFGACKGPDLDAAFARVRACRHCSPVRWPRPRPPVSSGRSQRGSDGLGSGKRFVLLRPHTVQHKIEQTVGA